MHDVEPTERNRRAFDDAYRSAENVLATPGIPPRVRERLADVAGSRVLHLLCGSGRESAELATLGALVTGVDHDEAALAAARRREPDLPLVQADVGALPPELLLGHWDLVYVGAGSLRRLRAARALAAAAAAALRTGGVLILHDEHPSASCLDAFQRWRSDYFATIGVGELVSAVAGAGLGVRGLEEWPGVDPRVPSHLVLTAQKD